ncbi:hypothetical protein INR49_006485, partial [Caranx melampygus]
MNENQLFKKSAYFLFYFIYLVKCAAATHSLRFFFTGASGKRTWPEFVAVTTVDDVEVIYCDSNIRRAEPKQDWMTELLEQDPTHTDTLTEECRVGQSSFSSNMREWMKLFNHTEGVHIYQSMFGCEWDDETQEVTGYYLYGYDGEDFLAFDLKTQTWIVPVPQAVVIKQRWDNDRASLIQLNDFLTQQCPERLKKYLNYGRSSLLRTVRPSAVSLLQKTPSSPVSCHATGFYPHRVLMVWTKDGEELHEDVDQGEILPNHDGTFQMTVDLDVSSVKAEDWRNCECVFQLYRLKVNIVTRLDKAQIRTNMVLYAGIRRGVGIVLLLAACITGMILYTRKL